MGMKAMLIAVFAVSCLACSGSASDSNGVVSSGPGSAAAEACSTDGSDAVAVGTYDRIYGGDLGWTAIVLTADCRFCFANGEHSSSRELASSSDGWSSSFAAGGTITVSHRGSDVPMTIQARGDKLDIGVATLYRADKGDSFACDGERVVR